MSSGKSHDIEHRPRIVVFGVGGAGGNAIANMVAARLEGVQFVVANTDSQALMRAKPEHRFQLGLAVTEGLGAGARPEVGRRAAEASEKDIAEKAAGAHMVFVTAGMGGGTGTGAAPVIARIAREAGALVVAVVTKPFEFEGSKRMRIAEEGVRELEREVDTLIVIPNQNLFRIATEKTSISEAFAMADEVLHSGVRGVTDLMTRPGIVNLDFADVRTVMGEMGKAVMGSGEAEGPRRAVEAAQAAVTNPLLDDITLRGAKAVLINISGGTGLTLYDVDEAANAIRADVEPDANIIVGSAIDEALDERVRVSVVATGIQPGAASRARRRAPPAPAPAERLAAAGFTFEPEGREPRPRAAMAQLRPGEPEDEDADEAEERGGADSTALGVIAALGAKAAERSEARASPAAWAGEDAEEEREEPAGRSGGFSLFGRRRRREAPEPPPEPAESEDDDLEIPAFLRRQAN